MRTLYGIITAILLITCAEAAEFSINSASFKDNAKIPVLYSCDGSNLSPELHWANPPANTQSYVLIMSSPDWSTGNVYFWILYNIPANVTQLAEGANQELPDVIYVGNNWYNETDYRGPCPPDSLLHHYVFTLYALDVNKLDLTSGAEIDDVLLKMHKHILKDVHITGVFTH